MSKKKVEPKKEERVKELKLKTDSIYFKKSQDEVKSISEILDVTTQIKELYVPLLGCKIKVGSVNFRAFKEIMLKKDDPEEMAAEMLFHHLRAADPKVTREQVSELPFNVMTAMVNVLTSEGLGFQIDSIADISSETPVSDT